MSLVQNSTSSHHHVEEEPEDESSLFRASQDVDLDVSLAAELTRLSLQERQDILHDLHGVSETLLETPQRIQDALHALDSELERTATSVYKMAMQEHASAPATTATRNLVREDSFRLLFLRCHEYNVPLAAKKLQALLQIKLELFGPSKLCREITLQDLSPEDRECLSNGHFQVLPTRDRAGRAVFMILSDIMEYTNILSELRQMYYVVMSSVQQDVETQIHGIVMIPWGLPRQQSPWHVWKANRLMGTLPFRVRGWHAILQDDQSGHLLSWLSSILDTQARRRMRIHSGTHQEVLYTLMTFGLPTREIPVQPDGSIDRTVHHAWIQARQALEEETAACFTNPSRSTGPSTISIVDENEELIAPQSLKQAATAPQRPHDETASQPQSPLHDRRSSSTLLPSSRDILFGRGKPYQQHAGNVRFSLMLEHLQDRYETLPRHHKTQLAQDIVRQLQSEGVRFIKRDPQQSQLWILVPDSVAREKVSQLFRSMRATTNSSSRQAKTPTVPNDKSSSQSANPRSQQDLSAPNKRARTTPPIPSSDHSPDA